MTFWCYIVLTTSPIIWLSVIKNTHDLLIYHDMQFIDTVWYVNAVYDMWYIVASLLAIDFVVHREDLNKLVYTSMCIKESMRLYPPVPMYTRQLTQDYTFDGYKLQKGVDITTHATYCTFPKVVYPMKINL